MSQLMTELQQGVALLDTWKQQFTQAVANGGNGAGVSACPLKDWVESGLSDEFKQDSHFATIQDLNQRVQHEAMKILTLAKEDRLDEAMTGLNFSGDFYKVLSKLTNEFTYWRESLAG
jgi:hypothetical protein